MGLFLFPVQRQLNLGYNLLSVYFMLYFLVFDDLYFVDLVVVYLVLCYPRFTVSLWFFCPSFN